MTTTATTVSRPPEVGQKAPDFTLPITKDQKFTLSEAVKKGPVLVAFFPGAFTGTCTKEFCNFTANWKAYESLGAQIIGVNVDSVHSQKAWAQKENITIPLASDFEKRVTKQYGVVWNAWWGETSKRATFLVDRSMTVRHRWVSEDAGVEPNYAEVQDAIRRLQ